VVPGLGETAGQALGRHVDVDCLAFTGSTAVGKMFLQYSGQSNMKQVWLETGGKSPNLVFSDCADLDAAADMAAFGIFFNQGQVCSANSRLLVERGIKDALVEKLAERAAATQPGDPLNPASKMGAMVDARHAANVMRFIDGGKKSARLVAGGGQVAVDGRGAFVQPTIFDEVSPDDRLARDEIFGPVLSVIRFKETDEVVARANTTDYGLAAAVWSRDIGKAHALADRIRAGTVWINSFDVFDAAAPFGGFKSSGIGRELGEAALDNYPEHKTVTVSLK
jgi:gamma-glutamyl-gamma-aminobutyraldehyde dehydrogenase